MLLSFVPAALAANNPVGLQSAAEHGRDTTKQQVRVKVENTNYTDQEGNTTQWYGTLVDEWVEIGNDSTVMSSVVAALNAKGYSQTGAESNYISEIAGLSELDGGFMSGWMGTLNDWFTNEGFGNFTVANGKLTAGDIINIVYTCDYGEDCGGSWGNNNTALKGLSFSTGTLSSAFAADTTAYTLSVPGGTGEVYVTPTAVNKNFQARIFVGETEYKRTAPIPVSNGTVITVKCGDPSWPSMNTSEGATTYTVTVSAPAAAVCDHANIANGVCPDCGAAEYTLELAPSTCSVTVDGYTLTDKGEQTISNKKYHVYTFMAQPEATVTYSGTDGAVDLGSGKLTLGAAPATYRLARHNFYASYGKGMEDWTLSAFTDKTDSAVYTLGTKFDDNGTAKQCALLIGGHQYGGTVTMNAALEEDYYLKSFSDFTVSATVNAVQNKTLPITAYYQFKLTAPSDADSVEFFEQTANFVVKALDTSGMTTKDNGDGTTTYCFKSQSTNYSYQHMWRVSKSGKTTQAGYMKNGSAITVTWNEHGPETKANYPNDENFNYDDNSVLLNIDDSKDTNELAMTVGETFKLRAFRNGWEIISDVSGNKMIEPDFHYAILSGGDVISVAPVTDQLTGNAKNNWMNVTALKNGTAVLAVWYDAIEIKGSAQFDGFYGATDAARYGYVVVNVGDDATVDITPISQDGDWDAEFDTVYYAGNDGGIFSFTSDDAQVVTVTNLCGTTMGAAQTVEKSNGKWNVPVMNGSNLITITSASGTDYRLVRAKKVSAVITNVTTGKTNADNDFVIHVGDTVSVSLDKLDMPLPKMSGLYNPGFGGTCKMIYMIDGKYTLVSKGTQYNFPTPKLCTVTFVASEAGTIRLGDGYITTGVFGSQPGAHRGLTDAGKPVNTSAPENSYCFGKLPELTLNVVEGDPVSYDDMTELTSLNIHVGYFSGMGTTKYVEFKAAEDSTATWKNNTNANSYLSITACPKMYSNTMKLTYWYEGEAVHTVNVPANNELRIPVGDTWSVQSGKMLNLVFTVTPADGNTAEAKSYHYVVMGGTAKLKYVHPVITALSATDGEGKALPLNKSVNFTDQDYSLNVGESTSISLSADMLQQTVSTTANTNDKADVVSVQRMKSGVAVGDPISVLPADENAYPVGHWTLDSLDISNADAIEITVTSYADTTVSRKYTVTLTTGETLLLGDVDGNGSVNSVDAALLYAFHNGKTTLAAEALARADVNGDSAVNSIDAAMIYAYHNGKISSFETVDE